MLDGYAILSQACCVILLLLLKFVSEAVSLTGVVLMIIVYVLGDCDFEGQGTEVPEFDR